jgi:hypothetical protein
LITFDGQDAMSIPCDPAEALRVVAYYTEEFSDSRSIKLVSFRQQPFPLQSISARSESQLNSSLDLIQMVVLKFTERSPVSS